MSKVLTGPLEQARGVIGRYPDPDEEYIFEFDTAKTRRVHMLGVRRPLKVVFLVDDEVTHEAVLRPWVGTAKARCNRIVESQPDKTHE